MLGLSIVDPLGVENGGVGRSVHGLGILQSRTVMKAEKTVRQVDGTTRGYEIHMGETVSEPNDSDRVFGTYVHGLFDDDAYRHRFIAGERAKSGLSPAEKFVCVTAQRQQRINRWANHLRQSLDMNLIRGWL
jgi:adenosylcobyric acid synthase